MVHFLDRQMMFEGPVNHGLATQGLVVLGPIKRLSEQAPSSEPVSSIAP